MQFADSCLCIVAVLVNQKSKSWWISAQTNDAATTAFQYELQHVCYATS